MENSKQYSAFFGRFQPLHDGHKWLFEQRLKEGKNIWIGVRDVEPDENNPWTADEVVMNLRKEFRNLWLEGRVKITIIPDIESINYGRDVGYDIIEHQPPGSIYQISATNIREQLKKEGKI